MENKRALFLVEKSDLSEKDKEFLKTHLTLYRDREESLLYEVMLAKDELDGYKKSISHYLSDHINASILLEAAIEKMQFLIDEIDKTENQLLKDKSNELIAELIKLHKEWDKLISI